jgi:DNA mismatch endonuclease (patch repair protein)
VDVFTRQKRSTIMAAIRSANTTPERVLRSALHRRGYRYILHDRRLPGAPDIVFSSRRIAIQVRGCFWHGHASCIDGHLPKTRRSYWLPKIHGNKRRDNRNDRSLRGLGWKVIVVWECRILNARTRTSEIRRVIRELEASSLRCPDG